uniref:PTB domain-containing engulfment adapter protein 1 n=1 Tax=Sus scrofa TaxID=9823 RepID=A0A8W4FAP2_PIG
MNRAFSRKKDKTWMHTPEALSKHYIPYNAKFLGSTEVEQPKGTEVVRDAVRKLKFARHIKKSEGQKIPKVELQISIYGVKILEPKTKEVQHNCQLHRISFCADDKTDKRIFTFICKDSESNKHLCYVFDSEKCVSMPDVLGWLVLFYKPGIVLFPVLVKYLEVNKVCKYLTTLIDSSCHENMF